MRLLDKRGLEGWRALSTTEFFRSAVADGRLVVERSVEGSPSVDHPLPAHALAAYRDTARLVDGSEHPRVQEFARLVEDVALGGPAQTTYWHAERAPS